MDEGFNGWGDLRPPLPEAGGRGGGWLYLLHQKCENPTSTKADLYQYPVAYDSGSQTVPKYHMIYCKSRYVPPEIFAIE